jgi:hypothetical protein
MNLYLNDSIEFVIAVRCSLTSLYSYYLQVFKIFDRSTKLYIHDKNGTNLFLNALSHYRLQLIQSEKLIFNKIK